MGICYSSNNDAQQAEKSLQIDKQIDKEKSLQEYKILLLGSGESGKSTVLKQMKIINQNGFNKDELKAWKIIVYRNLFESAQAITRAIDHFNLTYKDEVNNDYADIVKSYTHIPSSKSHCFEKSYIDAIQSIWKDESIKTLIQERSDEFYLMDSASYFFGDIERIGKIDYLPNEQDVLRARLKTTGITETRFQLHQTYIHMFDMGGQRSERRKWIHCFDSVTSIIFCVALSEYDQVLIEERRQNRMLESITLFESVVNSRWFRYTSVMLFLNKVDLFRTKITRVPLGNNFPDYTGGSDVNKAVKYILWRFTKANKQKLSVYPHLTQATNTNNIRFVFVTLRDIVLQNELKSTGMM